MAVLGALFLLIVKGIYGDEKFDKDMRVLSYFA